MSQTPENSNDIPGLNTEEENAANIATYNVAHPEGYQYTGQQETAVQRDTVAQLLAEMLATMDLSPEDLVELQKYSQ